MRRKDQPCVCCGERPRECDCRWDGQICYRCGCCARHCICIGGARSGMIYMDGSLDDGFKVEVRR